MIKKILVPVFLFFSLVSIAQQATSSPYSFYGIGDVRFKGTVDNRLMGGVSVFSDSIHINLQNPASYSSLKLSTFSVGAAFNSAHLTSYQGTEKAQRTTVDYMAVAMPILKSSTITFGLIPYSAVGYRIKNDNGEIIRRYEGKGGLNKVFLGYGFHINKNLSLGADISYNFGNIETTNIKYIYQPVVQLGTEENNTSKMSGLGVKLGLMYEKKFKKYDYFGSLSFTPQTGLKSNNVRQLYSIQYSDDYTPPIAGTLDPEKSSSTIKLPSEFSVGAGFGRARKWLVGAEVIFKQSGSFSNRFFDVNQAVFENGMQYRLGGYYVPNYNAFSNYLKKITYRAGLRYEKTGMIIRNESIKDYAFTGGFGLPLGGVFSNLNLGVELGRRGTAKANLVEENYTNVIMSLSLNDKWFVKRKFD